MKQNFGLRISSILMIVMSLILVISVSAQKSASFEKTSSTESIGPGTTLLVEDFTYAPGALLTDNGWTAHSGAGTNSIVTSSPGLTLTGYPSSGVGNAVALTTSGEDVNRTFAPQSSGSVYAAFMVNASDASLTTPGGYFFHLGPDPVGTTFRGRVFIVKDATNNVAFGISKAATAAADVVLTPFSYSLNTTYLVVIKYNIVAGDTNDTVNLFVSTTVPVSEPAPTVSASDVGATDSTMGTVSLRQGTAATHPTAKVDGIRVGTTWASVTQAVTAPTQNHVDFDGNGKTDFVVVRNTGGGPMGQITWFVALNGPGTTSGSQWGLATDFFVPADYDGDNKTDIAVWRPVSTAQPFGNAYFYILQSETNTVRIDDFGQTGDNPRVIGDYDGDGKDDVAVYRAGAVALAPSTWYYRGSLTPANISAVGWGQNGDFPAPGDYDGDGKNDFVIQRNNGGGSAAFWRNRTTAGFDVVVYGTPTDPITPGDYDGDGKTDIAVVRGVGGKILWYYLRSIDGVSITNEFGNSATDFPTQGDYDGDGKTDQAIWRPSASPGGSAFWVNGSTSGVGGIGFGQNGDYPVANYNVF